MPYPSCFVASNIASVDIPRDASATAIYGFQAANGVVLIMTGRSKMGASGVNFNAYVGIRPSAFRVKIADGGWWVDGVCPENLCLGFVWKLMQKKPNIRR